MEKKMDKKLRKKWFDHSIEPCQRILNVDNSALDQSKGQIIVHQLERINVMITIGLFSKLGETLF